MSARAGGGRAPRTVLYVQGSAERAGAERVLGILLRHLDRRRIRPVVAFCARGPFIDELTSEGVEVLRLPEVPRLRQPWQAPGFVRDLAEAVRGSGADVVQATGEKMSVYSGWASRAAGRPCVFWLHDSPGTSVGARLTQLAMATTPRTRVVACAEWLARTFDGHRLGAEAIPNGIDLAELPAGDPAGLRAEAGWPRDAVVVGHFARLERWKGTETFLEAAARVADAHPRARFLVVGGALYGRGEDYAAALPRLADRLGLADRVRFTGYRSDALELMASGDVVVHASLRADPFPTVVLEGMALGLPVVATRTRGPEEQIADGRDGLLVRPGDPGDMEDALARLLGSEAHRRAVGRAARRTVAERFDAGTMARRFEALYAELVGDPVSRVAS